MKTIEIRRHSTRSYSGQNLSQEGVHLARQIGNDMQGFDRVVTSPLPRAIQTAVAMGFAVNDTADLLARFEQGLAIDSALGGGFQDYSHAVRTNPATAHFAQELAGFYQKLAQGLPEGGSALVINHSGIVELSAVACLPNENLDHFGDSIHYCEGVRLSWNNGAFTSAEILRV
jgi:hypothetical protein